MGKLINREDVWMKRLEEIKEYLDKYEKRPSKKSKNKTEKFLGIWTCLQQTNFSQNKMQNA